MKTDKLIKISLEHAQAMYAIALEKHQRDTERFLKTRKEKGNKIK